MTADTRVFDADGHVIEPTDLYFGGLDPAFRDRVEVDHSLGEHHGRLFPLDGEALPRLPAEPADATVAERLRRSTGEITAWELAHPANPQAVSLGHAIGM